MATRTVGEALAYTANLCLPPVGLMFFGSVMVLSKSPPEVFVQMTQHFGAGIVLSAVCTELLPYITDGPQDGAGLYTISILVGFFLGVGLMVMVEKTCGKEEAEEEEEEHERAVLLQHKQQQQAQYNSRALEKALHKRTSSSPPRADQPPPRDSSAPTTPIMRTRSLMEGYRRHRLSVGSENDGISPMRGGYGSTSTTTTTTKPSQHRSSLSRGGESNQSESTNLLLNGLGLSSSSEVVVPWPLIIAVYVDSFMDGLLIGISAIAGANAGIIMSIALSIEMMFLGLTFAASLLPLPKGPRLVLITCAPLTILVGGTVGSVAASVLTTNPHLQVGLISFGMAALLYLVTEELLVEAHEENAGHIWYVDLQFFVGFIASVLLEKIMEDK